MAHQYVMIFPEKISNSKWKTDLFHELPEFPPLLE